MQEVALGWFGVPWWGRARRRAFRRWQGRAESRQARLLRRIVHQDARARRPAALPGQRQWRALQNEFVVAHGCVAAGAPPGRPGRATRPNDLEITGLYPLCKFLWRDPRLTSFTKGYMRGAKRNSFHPVFCSGASRTSSRPARSAWRRAPRI